MRAAQVTIGTIIKMTRASQRRARTVELEASAMPTSFRWKSADCGPRRRDGLTFLFEGVNSGATPIQSVEVTT
jgi:hypothetical protein